jgi:hypothetical protein
MEPLAMRRTHLVLATLLGVGLAWSVVAPARGSSLPAYTITDLGIGAPRLSTDASGNGVAIGPDGQIYAFPRTDNSVPDPSSLLKQLPALTNAPVNDQMTYGNPKYAYSYFSSGGVFLSQNGLFAGTDFLGVDGHSSGSESIAMVSQRQADGTFGPLVSLVTSPANQYSGGQPAEVLDLNNRGQALILAGTYGGAPFGRELVLSDAHSGTTISIMSLLSGWWLWLTPVGPVLDDDGRILLTAEDSSTTMHTLLLTPAGVPSDPMPVPEPTALALFTAGAVGGLACRRALKRKRVPAEPRAA